jgi:hypothetical protein
MPTNTGMRNGMTDLLFVVVLGRQRHDFIGVSSGAEFLVEGSGGTFIEFQNRHE